MSLTLTIMGWYYVVTGVWPILHMKSFETVTGPKTDKWLVKTVSLMILCSGIIYIKYSESEPAKFLAIMNALSLSFIDIYYSVKGVIRKVYLADAVLEFVFVGILMFVK